MAGIRIVSLDNQREYQPGDPAPEGYMAWHEWAGVQHKAGLRQQRCGHCLLWKYPQELSDKTVTQTATTRKHGGQTVTRTSPICRDCAEIRK
jgi:hypothetical protein